MAQATKSQIEKPGARKRGAPKDVPLPGRGLVQRFHGVFNGFAVTISDPLEMWDLYDCGYYGKGTMSRGRPNFHQRDMQAPRRRKKKMRKEPKAKRLEGGFHLAAVEFQLEKEREEASKNPNAGKSGAVIAADGVYEHLQLTLEEAYYLAYVLGVLEIHDITGQLMGLRQAWNLFRVAQPSFLHAYVVYHYYRSHGWCPKAGLKYGTDFVLYRKGPSFYHAEYAVIVQDSDEATKSSPSNLRTVSWTSLLNLNRVSEQVAKGLMLCYVLSPATIDPKELESPECISKFTLQEVQVKRWTPSTTTCTL